MPVLAPALALALVLLQSVLADSGSDIGSAEIRNLVLVSTPCSDSDSDLD